MALPRSTPSAQGVAASGVAAFVDALEQHPGIDPHGLILVRHGQVVAEGWWAPYSADRLHLLYSLSKTFMSTAVGFAVQEGLFSLDDAVADHFPEFKDELPEASRRILVRHALAMASGHDAEMVQAALETDPGRAGPRLPAARPRARARQLVRLQPARQLHGRGDPAAGGGHRPRLLPPAAAARPARHPAGELAGVPGRPLARLLRPARDDRDVREARAAAPRRRRVGGGAAAARGLGGGGAHEPRLDGPRDQPGLGPGLRLPGLDGAARLPRRRRLRPVHGDPAGARRRAGDQLRGGGHAGRARRRVDPSAARVRRRR